jgi:hypothetical protein
MDLLENKFDLVGMLLAGMLVFCVVRKIWKKGKGSGWSWEFLIFDLG